MSIHPLATSPTHTPGRADVERWARLSDLSEDRRISWRRRARTAASFIKLHSSVLDLGCGMMPLEEELPEGCRYTPSDCVPRDSRTIVLDYHEALPPPGDYDYVVALGVAEYLEDPETFFTRLTSYGATLIFSYHPADRFIGVPPADYGWPNLATTGQLAASLARGDFVVILQGELKCNELLYVAIPSPIRLG